MFTTSYIDTQRGVVDEFILLHKIRRVYVKCNGGVTRIYHSRNSHGMQYPYRRAEKVKPFGSGFILLQLEIEPHVK